MTFSDSRIVKALKEDWIPVWESVSPVKEVTFELGEGRTVRGTVGGEIAIYFCDEQGRVFDILPALQSPAATLKAIERALAFYKSKKGVMDAASVVEFHRERMRGTLEAIYNSHPERFPKPDPLTVALLAAVPVEADEPRPNEKAVEQVAAKNLYPGTAKNEAYRQAAINTALDDATRDLRLMVFSKVAATAPSEGKITVVEPGGRGYYMWQVGQGFCGVVPDRENLVARVNYPKAEWILREIHAKPRVILPPLIEEPVPPKKTVQLHPLGIGVWSAELKQPSGWKRLLFEGILHQPLGGGKFKYDSESLKALSIIED